MAVLIEIGRAGASDGACTRLATNQAQDRASAQIRGRSTVV